jgi:hypothetical protein
VGTLIAAAVGGAIAGYLAGTAIADKANTQLPVGFSVIGATLGGFGVYSSVKETLYYVDQPPAAPK